MVNSRKEIKFRRLTIWHILRGENIQYAKQGRSIKLLRLLALLVIRWVGIRILGSVPLTIGSGADPDADSEHQYIYIILHR
jgi:hypothetical protein